MEPGNTATRFRQPIGPWHIPVARWIGWRTLPPPRSVGGESVELQASDDRSFTIPTEVIQKRRAPFSPRRNWLLAAAALVAGAVLLPLVLPGHRRHYERPHSAAHVPLASHHTAGLAGVGMPGTLLGTVPTKPIRVVLVINGTFTPAVELRELRALGTWLQAHINPASRITVINIADLKTTRALSPRLVGSVLPHYPALAAPAAVRAGLHAGHGAALLVALRSNVGMRLRNLTRLRISTRNGAREPRDLGLRPGRSATVVIDPRRARSFAATVARAVILVSRLRPS
jgi:hypothetical protein